MGRRSAKAGPGTVTTGSAGETGSKAVAAPGTRETLPQGGGRSPQPFGRVYLGLRSRIKRGSIKQCLQPKSNSGRIYHAHACGGGCATGLCVRRTPATDTEIKLLKLQRLPRPHDRHSRSNSSPRWYVAIGHRVATAATAVRAHVVLARAVSQFL